MQQPQLSKPRQLTSLEIEIVDHLIGLSGQGGFDAFDKEYMARDYIGHLCGSVMLVPSNTVESDRDTGDVLARACFIDSDGVSVSVWLIGDSDGKLFELDIWKADDSRIIAWPDLSKVLPEEQSSHRNG